MFNNKKINKILENQEKIIKDIQSLKNSISVLKKSKKDENIDKKVEIDEPVKEVKKTIKKAKKVKIKYDTQPWNLARQAKIAKNEHLALKTEAKDRKYPIEYEAKNKTDMSVNEFAKVLDVDAQVLRSRLNLLRTQGVNWVNNDNFIYYIRKPHTNYLIKMLTKPAQDYLLRRYGKGKDNRGGKRA